MQMCIQTHAHTYIKDKMSQAWWCTPLIPAREACYLSVHGQPGLQSEFQNSQEYTKNMYQKSDQNKQITNKKKNKKREKRKEEREK